MDDLKQMCESYERVLKKRMESLPDYNLKELRRAVTDKNTPAAAATVGTGQTAAKKTEGNKTNTTIKTTKTQKMEEGDFFIGKIIKIKIAPSNRETKRKQGSRTRS